MAKGASAVWEIRPTAGSDTNGGAYDSTIVSAGTDYSQQNATQLSVSDGVENGTTTVTSVTGGFTAAMIGNALYDGTDRFFITAVASTNSITVDRATGTATGLTLKVGGALATLTEAYSARGGVGSNTFWVKASGTMSITSTLTPPAGAVGKPTITAGYNATRGDLDAVNNFANFPTVQVNNVAIVAFTMSNVYQRLRNLIIDGAGGATKGTRGVNTSAHYQVIENLKISNFAGVGINHQDQAVITRRCLVTGMTAAATAGYSANGNVVQFDSCVATANACPGFNAGSAGGVPVFVRCLSYANTGASSDGFQATGTYGALFLGCVSYANGRDGIRFDGTDSADIAGAYGCILSQNTGKGMNSATTTWADLPMNYNAFYLNTGGARNGVPTGANDITLTGDPFTNAAGGDFSLNNTAGAGAGCRAAGFPGVFPAGTTTAYLDIGAVQHQDSGGSTAAGDTAFLNIGLMGWW